MKRGRKKNSNYCSAKVQLNGRRRFLSCDKDDIKHRRKRSADICNNTLPASKRSSDRFYIPEELSKICEVVTPPLSNASSRKSSSTSESPSRKSLSPFKETPPPSEESSPSEESQSPLKEARSPLKETQSPTKESSLPSEEVLSPTEKSPFALEKSTAPLEESISPPEESTAPSVELSLSGKNVWKQSPTSDSLLCRYCRDPKEAVLNSSKPLEGAHEEEDVLNFKEIRTSWKTENDLPCLKLTNFRVYDKARHLCPFDGHLIKQSVSLYFSGYVKPFDSETADSADGFPCEDMGPIREWWFEGYSLDEETKLGFSSDLSHYYLIQPMEEYVPCLTRVNEKVFMAKTVVDILDKASDDDDITYDTLLSKLLTAIPPPGVPSITEEILLRNGIFICEQIMSYDSGADEDDKLLTTMSCSQELSKLVGFDYNAKNDDDIIDLDDEDSDASVNDDDDDKDVIEVIVLDDSDEEDTGTKQMKRKRRKEPMRKSVNGVQKAVKYTLATTTPLVENIFESFFHGRIMMNYIKDYSKDNVKSYTTNQYYNSVRCYDIKDFSIRITKLEDLGMDCQNYKIRSFGEYECETEDVLNITQMVTRELKAVLLTRLSEETIKLHMNKGRKPARKTKYIELSDDDSDSDCAPKRKKIAHAKPVDSPACSLDELRRMFRRRKTRRSSPTSIEWVDEPIKEIDGFTYYKSVMVSGIKISVGDFVATYSSNSIARVRYLFENNEDEKLFHVHWFTRSMDTILAEVGHPNELFESNLCEDVFLSDFYQVVQVEYIPTGSDWLETGNMALMNRLNEERDPTCDLFYQKKYCEKTARFEDVEPELPSSLIDCYNCEEQRKLTQKEIPYTEEKSTFDKENNMYALTMVRWRDEEYRIGSCVFLTPGTIMKPQPKAKENEEEENFNEELFPEKYRKPAHVRSIQDEDVLSDPFEIGYICNIWSKRQNITSSSDVKLELKKFYRPHNTALSPKVIRKLDLNLVYWSDDECVVDFSKVQGKCYVSFEENLKCPLDEWTSKGPFRFYFSDSYSKKFRLFETPPRFAMKIGNLEKVDEKFHVDVPPEYPTISRALRSLDVFAGCGGLTEGLHQAKVAECLWAIEKDAAAARAFQANYPDATVFTEDCNELLNAVRRGDQYRNGKKLPQRGDVELLCGGPPCQGFSGMNRFRCGQWSQFNNSLIVSFLSYCDFYKPRFFIMENVRNFVSHEKSIVLKLTLNCLVKMGYQVAFGVLQSGRFGIPQSRRRVIILAAAPGEVLPLHPECTHTFALTGSFEAVNVDDVKYITSARWTSSAPYRMITVYDAISDLPPIREGDSLVERKYGREPVTHFQRQVRTYDGIQETVLKDHIAKSLSALVVKRLSFIPKKPGCDWRDLPNIVVKLSDGSYTKKLQYTHHDVRQGKSSTGALRGVCCCASNSKCKPEFRQSDTLIPWCLPHTSNRHGHWRGLYGRLGWDEYFRTVVTNPEPMGKQGRVVHPEEDRVISVRECARSQGFPDRFKFYGYILDKHRQIGNAVAPPLAKAIGLEIVKSIHQVESKVHASVN